MPLHEYVASNLGLMFSRDDGFADREKTSNLLQPVIDWGFFFFLPLDILFIYLFILISFLLFPHYHVTNGSLESQRPAVISS